MNSDDWRRQGQERYLSGVKLVPRNYAPYRLDWDHDHCEFCGARFSLNNGDLKTGYSTEDGYYWICNQCFKDFSHIFNWHVSDSPKVPLSNDCQKTENEDTESKIDIKPSKDLDEIGTARE